MLIKNAKWTETRNFNGIELEVGFQYVDEGIGAYECHGYRGCQHDWQVECVSVLKDGKPFDDVDDDTIRKWEEEAKIPDDGKDDFPPITD